MKKDNPAIFLSIKILYNYRALVLVIGAFLFFYFYNALLVDQSLTNLSIILSKTTTAKSFSDLSGVNYLLDSSIQGEVEKERINSDQIIPLTISKNIVDTSGEFDQLMDLEFNLKQLQDQKQKNRNLMLKIFDIITSVTTRALDFINPRLLINKLGQKELAIKINPRFLNMAKEAMTKSNYKDAAGYYELFILKYPDYQKINYVKLNLAEAYKKLFDYDKAKKLYIQIIDSSASVEEYQTAGQLFKQLKDLYAARDKIDTLIIDLKNPSLSSSQKQEIFYEIISLALKISNLNIAEESYNKLYELNPSSELFQKARYDLAWSYKLQGNIEKSQEIFAKIAKETKDSTLATDTKFQMSDNYKRLGQFKESVQISQDITKDMKNEDLKDIILLETASTYLYNLKDPETALEILKEISKSKKIGKRFMNYIEAKSAAIRSSQRFLGEQLLIKGFYTEAISSFRLALKDSPWDAKIYADLAIAYSKLNNFEKATEFIRKALDLKQDDAYIQAVAGYIYLRLQKYDDAIESFWKAIDLNNNYLEAYYNLSYIYLLKGEYESAIKTLSQVVKIDPKYIEVYANLGYAYLKINNLDMSIENSKKALEIYPNFLNANYNLALAYEKKKMLKEAKEQYSKVLSLKPDFKDALDGIKRIENSGK